MTLGGIVKHLAFVEDYWFSYVFVNRDYQPPWGSVDWHTDPDWDWHSAAADTPEQIISLWRDSTDRSRAVVTQAITEGGLGQLAQRPWPDRGPLPSLRWILCHMIEEYARHNGHADLIRESIDGQTGE